MHTSLFFVTGTDTGVGKTIFTAFTTSYLRKQNVNAVALKPVSSGNRNDARILCRAAGGALPLEAVNPWHFRAPLAPLAAARRERRRVQLREVVEHIRRIAPRFDVVLIEGAGGLLSPLGEDFDSRDLIMALRSEPFVLCPNRLGAINQLLLAWEALPSRTRCEATAVLVSPPRPTLVSRVNKELLAERLGPGRVISMPWLRADRVLA
jgi:dethiobiotin synthetase